MTDDDNKKTAPREYIAEIDGKRRKESGRALLIILIAVMIIVGRTLACRFDDRCRSACPRQSWLCR
ncbi:hypothetical protein N2599_23655 (plasmid) [Rhizobium sullae]|uniref:Uncharacterized protein n=1 Tax=Rhizobium sullae TaxID=50338 RepID=A0ABY5XVG3_RHISU|nr:hypothetical protein [Rhizobium sullae]UWU18256.1 hypothetical protein N2599_23655 [Rhizobium sullae]